MPRLELLALWLVFAQACAGQDEQCQELCDATSEMCVIQEACRFLQNGNPTPFETDRYSCMALPARCSGERTCDCVQCRGAQEEDDCLRAAGCAEPVDDGPVILRFGCE